MATDTNYLCIGHCCHDKTDDGYILGGTVSYASMIAHDLGMQVAMLTAVGDDFLFERTFKESGIAYYNKPSSHTTIFENIYEGEVRTQFLQARALSLSSTDVPEELTRANIVHLGLIADEIDFGILDNFKESLIGLSIQGALRQWDEHGLVSIKAMDWMSLRKVDIVFVSEDDIEGHGQYLGQILNYVDHVVLTKGARGAIVYFAGKAHYFPVYPSEAVDATGAGDAFATAYLIEYQRTADIMAACIFAHCTASVIIENKGLATLPTSESVENRVQDYHSRYQFL